MSSIKIEALLLVLFPSLARPCEEHNGWGLQNTTKWPNNLLRLSNTARVLWLTFEVVYLIQRFSGMLCGDKDCVDNPIPDSSCLR